MLTALLAEPGRVIKEAPAKRVSVHEISGRVFYVKRYRHDAVALRTLKFFLKRSPARKEWELAQRLEALGVPVVRHLAHGERRDWRGLRESVLITEGFAGRPLDEVPGLPAAAVLDFVARLHERGVLHADLHSGNILARPDPLEIRLLDLDKAHIKPALTAEEREDNLAFLGISFPLPLTGRAAARREELRRELYRERSRRCLRHNREFAPRRAGGLTWHVRLPLLRAEEAAADTASLSNSLSPARSGGEGRGEGGIPRAEAPPLPSPLLHPMEEREPADGAFIAVSGCARPEVQRVLADPDEFLRARAKILKAGGASTVGAADGLVLKRFNFRKPLNLLKDLLRPSRAFRAFRMSYHLELAGVPTPRVVAAAERRVLGLLVRSYLLMEEIPGATTLQKLLRGGTPLPRGLVAEAARLVARLHDEGFTHGDLNERNLVLDARSRLELIDLDALEFAGAVPASRAADDLARLGRDVARHAGVSRAAREAFVRHYCRARRLRRVPRPA